MDEPSCSGAGSGQPGADQSGGPGAARGERLLRRAETVLANRTERILLVLERCTDNQNYLACLRTAEMLGVQDVWIVLAPRGGKNEALLVEDAEAEDGDGAGGFVDKGELSRKRTRISKGTSQWLDLRTFTTTRECISELLRAGREIWATDLARGAVLLEPGAGLQLPRRLAVVMGREADGVSQEMLAAAHKRVCLPMWGFNDSFNLSISTGMVLQLLLQACPEARGDMDPERVAALRADWYAKLARTAAQRAEFAARLADPPPPYSSLREEDDGLLPPGGCPADDDAGRASPPAEPEGNKAKKEKMQAAGEGSCPALQ